MGHIEIDFDFKGDESCSFKMNTNCAIDGHHGEDTEGEYLGNIMVYERKWAIVVIDGEEDPTLVKASHILLESKQWRPVD